jgi:hypothetical protein
MNARERAVLKQVLRALKIARGSDPVSERLYFGSDYFVEEVLEPLEKLSGWNTVTDDESEVRTEIEGLHEAAGGRTLQDRSQSFRQLLKIGGGILGAGAMFLGMKYIHRRLRSRNRTGPM